MTYSDENFSTPLEQQTRQTKVYRPINRNSEATFIVSHCYSLKKNTKRKTIYTKTENDGVGSSSINFIRFHVIVTDDCRKNKCLHFCPMVSKAKRKNCRSQVVGKKTHLKTTSTGQIVAKLTIER